ncbi:MAG: hypothetical protein DMG56_15210 [Acidobacteria bacterium]|nr:MAG: hypothetical protein DMG56_15210 [Acidobacteriota bacterium]
MASHNLRRSSVAGSPAANFLDAFFQGAFLSYAEKHLIAGETVQYETRLHWIVMLGHALIASVLAFIAIALLVASPSSWQGAKVATPRGVMYWAALTCLMLGAIFFCIGLLKRNATEMAVTNKRVIVKSGLANRRTIELLLPRIESIAVEEPALGRLLGYGTVIVRGTGGTPEVFSQIARPLEFREQVQRQIAGEPKRS